MDSRQKKIALLTRMNRGRVAIPSFLNALSDALHEPIDASALVSLPESDALMDVFRGGYEIAAAGGPLSYRKFFRRREEPLVLKLAGCLAGRLLSEEVYFLPKQSEDCGGVRLSISALLRQPESIIRLDGDSVSAVSLDRSQGLLIDQNPDDQMQAYEVAVWGDRWSVLAFECDPR